MYKSDHELEQGVGPDPLDPPPGHAPARMPWPTSALSTPLISLIALTSLTASYSASWYQLLCETRLVVEIFTKSEIRSHYESEFGHVVFGIS